MLQALLKSSPHAPLRVQCCPLISYSVMAAKLDVKSSWYKDALEHTSAYNSRLCFERKQRSPFLDSQTGVAQVNCYLWKSKLSRRTPAYPYQIYSYPGRRWKRKTRKEPVAAEETPVTVDQPQSVSTSVDNIDQLVLSTAESNSGNVEENAELVDQEVEEESEEGSDDDSDVEDELIVRKPGRPGRPPKRNLQSNLATIGNYKLAKVDPSTLKVKNFTKEELARMSYDERQKPYVCEICGKRYKNGPGLKYHYTHYNHDQDGLTSEIAEVNPVSTQGLTLPGSPSDANFHSAVSSSTVAPGKEGQSSSITPNDYCDFCLGDATKNRKTLMSEELLSCADCGRCGHPSCLQFTAKLTTNVKKYRWQCIECKSCTLCGTSDNDDQLLFCDDCDRGYHMYCLQPPMDTPPEGSWTCKLCEEDASME